MQNVIKCEESIYDFSSLVSCCSKIPRFQTLFCWVPFILINTRKIFNSTKYKASKYFLNILNIHK